MDYYDHFKQAYELFQQYPGMAGAYNLARKSNPNVDFDAFSERYVDFQENPGLGSAYTASRKALGDFSDSTGDTPWRPQHPSRPQGSPSLSPSPYPMPGRPYPIPVRPQGSPSLSPSPYPMPGRPQSPPTSSPQAYLRAKPMGNSNV